MKVHQLLWLIPELFQLETTPEGNTGEQSQDMMQTKKKREQQRKTQ